MPHVQLADGRALLRTVGDTVDHHGAGPADAFSAIVIEGDRGLSLQLEFLVQHIEHFQE
jgi:hypothetical protein